MKLNKERYLKLFFIFFLLVFSISVISIVLNKAKKDAILAEEPITINLITSVHPNLPRSFKSTSKKITVKLGEVVTIEYFVKNLEKKILQA